VRKAKKKRIKALKAQARLKQAEEERNARKQAWQNFLQQGHSHKHKHKHTPLLLSSSFSLFIYFIYNELRFVVSIYIYTHTLNIKHTH
jgi:hypothetical protein